MQRSDYTTQQGITGKFNTMDYNHNVFQDSEMKPMEKPLLGPRSSLPARQFRKKNVRKTESGGSTCSTKSCPDTSSHHDMLSGRLLSQQVSKPQQTCLQSPYGESWMTKKPYASFRKQHTIRDVKFDSTGNILLSSRQSVQMYDPNGVFQEKLFTYRVAEPWGLHIDKHTGNVFVSDHEEDCIKEFNGLGLLAQEYGPISKPCGVTVSDSGYVFACSQSEACVCVFAPDGGLVRKLGSSVLHNPSHITIHDKIILVSDGARIIGFDIFDKVELIYGSTDECQHPASLCVDAERSFTLATSYYKNCLIAVRGDMVRAIKVKVSRRPILCAINSFGHLIIAENDPSGTIFKLYRM